MGTSRVESLSKPAVEKNLPLRLAVYSRDYFGKYHDYERDNEPGVDGVMQRLHDDTERQKR